MQKIEGEITRGVWYTIASKSAIKHHGAWRLHDDAVMSIDLAKAAYDKGEIEMAQGRDGANFYLRVLFRREKAADRLGWFARVESEHEQAMKKAEIRRALGSYAGARRQPQAQI